LETKNTKNVSGVKNVSYFCTMNEELKNILERVLCLYQKYGIKSITMDDVSRELGISKKTLYQYVADKTDLVAKVLELEMEKNRCNFESIVSGEKNAIEELIDVHRFVFKRIKDFNPSTEYDLRKYYPDLYRKTQEERQKKMYERILTNLKQGKAQGLYRKEINEEIITKVTVVRSEISTNVDAFSGNELFTPSFFTEVMIYHIRGIANEKGIKYLEENQHKFLDTMKE
jgi:TetR/AcrR family transcriptional regulator, cholesterol catabolism regulator